MAALRDALYLQTEFTLLRLYGAIEPLLDKTLRPSEIELMK